MFHVKHAADDPIASTVRTSCSVGRATGSNFSGHARPGPTMFHVKHRGCFHGFPQPPAVWVELMDIAPLRLLVVDLRLQR